VVQNTGGAQVPWTSGTSSIWPPVYLADEALRRIEAQPVRPQPMPPPPQVPRILDFDVTPRFVLPRASVTATWRAENATFCELEVPGSDQRIRVSSENDSHVFRVARSGNVVLSCAGNSGQRVERTERVRVRQERGPEPSPQQKTYCCSIVTRQRVCSWVSDGRLGVACACPGAASAGLTCP
jgi:hypothetical protein